MTSIQRVLIYATVIILGSVLGANVYNSIVDAQNWGSAIPASLDAAKAYFAHSNPGTFYRVASPAGQVAALLVLIATWRAGKSVRILAAAGLILAVLVDVMTFAYFYPRNAIMFGTEQHSVEELRQAWAGWDAMNWVRSGVCLLALIAELGVLSRVEIYLAERRVPKLT